MKEIIYCFDRRGCYVPEETAEFKNDAQLCLQFGRMASVDYYPNCDGEYDRWGTEWVTEYEVRFSAVTHKTEITAF